MSVGSWQSNASTLAICLLSFLFGVQFTQADETYLLRYRLQAGEQIVTQVTHHSETQTMISGASEDSSARTSSIKVWEVQSVDDSGNMTFEYRIDQVEISQTIADETSSYNSQTDSQAPAVFQQVAESVAKPLATITIDPTGELVRRDRDFNVPFLGIGEITIALPREAVAVGAQWHVARDLRLRLDQRKYKMIKVRELYCLEKVSAGVATISIATQPLTPIHDPAVEAQLIQQLSKGTIKFDIDSGRLLSKRLDWSEKVFGFQGPESSMRYGAQWTEELLPSRARMAAKTDSVR
jgi:hypothetical protein